MNDLEQKYIILNMLRVNKLDNGIVFSGKIKFLQLNEIHKRSLRKEAEHDPFDKKDIQKNDENDFQRDLSTKKINEIQKYLRLNLLQAKDGRTSSSMFPTALILYNRSYEIDDLIGVSKTTDLENIDISNIPTLPESELNCCFYTKDENYDNFYKLYIPRNEEITLIVDGQHRFYATKKLYDSISDQSADGINERKILEDFEFIVTFLVGFDIYEVGQVFATVNFKQKPVSRSLYYDIFGAAPQTDNQDRLYNEIRLAHILALHLNNSNKSPLKGMIKLLGKGNGLISQAFLVENLRDHVFRQHIWDDYIEDYVNGGAKYKITADFLRAYFEAIKIAYSSFWPRLVHDKEGNEVYKATEYDYSILCKTTGMGAFLRLIKDIYPLVKTDPANFKENILNIFSKLKDDEADKYFSSNEGYGKAGSEGLQAGLYKELKMLYGLDQQLSLV